MWAVLIVSHCIFVFVLKLALKQISHKVHRGITKPTVAAEIGLQTIFQMMLEKVIWKMHGGTIAYCSTLSKTKSSCGENCF